jgi:hypothetical protein
MLLPLLQDQLTPNKQQRLRLVRCAVAPGSFHPWQRNSRFPRESTSRSANQTAELFGQPLPNVNEAIESFILTTPAR